MPDLVLSGNPLRYRIQCPPGTRYGRLTVLRETRRLSPAGKRRAMVCRCDCGTECVRLLASLSGGYTRSCGCLRVEIARESARIMGRGNRRAG